MVKFLLPLLDCPGGTERETFPALSATVFTSAIVLQGKGGKNGHQTYACAVEGIDEQIVSADPAKAGLNCQMLV